MKSWTRNEIGHFDINFETGECYWSFFRLPSFSAHSGMHHKPLMMQKKSQRKIDSWDAR